LRVTLQDQAADCLTPMMKRAHSLFKKKLKQPHLITQAMDRIVPDVPGHGLKFADVVIEAIFEQVAAKHALYKRIEPLMKADALLLTNTSSITLEVLSSVLKRPGRLVGLHFFNPVAMMQLVEVVVGQHSDPAAVQQACDFTRRIDRLPLPVKSGPGFLVNRVLMPYLMEAVTLLEEGVPAQSIDRAAKQFGMPMGPIELADTVGLDICLHVAEILAQDLPIRIPKRLKSLVEQGHLGRKSGQGFYRYNKGQKVLSNKTQTCTEALQERLISRLVQEAQLCLREQVVKTTELLDAGIIFGTGFAPFRGGPMHYQKTLESTKPNTRAEG